MQKYIKSTLMGNTIKKNHFETIFKVLREIVTEDQDKKCLFLMELK